MKKKIIGGFAVLAIAAMAAWNVNYGSQTKGMTDVMLANVEALAQNEYDWHEDRADIYDEENHCYQQCVKDGDGCAYMYDFPYNC